MDFKDSCLCVLLMYLYRTEADLNAPRFGASAHRRRLHTFARMAAAESSAHPTALAP